MHIRNELDLFQCMLVWMMMWTPEKFTKGLDRAIIATFPVVNILPVNMAHTIRPKAYQIQHAIGRNYLKYANYLTDILQAESLFAQGEEIMLGLINSSEYYKEKARNFSIHCYTFEKILYIKRHNKNVTNRELLQIKRYIDMIMDDKDVYIDSLAVQYIALLRKLDKLDIINMRPGDIYYQALGKKDEYQEEQDVLIESY